MNRIAVAVVCAVLLVGATPRHGPPPNTAFQVCLREKGEQWRVAVSGHEAKRLNRGALDDWTKTQVKNALLEIMMRRGGDLSRPIEVRFESLEKRLGAAPGTEGMTRRKDPNPMEWGAQNDRCYECRCARAIYGSKKEFLGCTVDGCDGCMVCKPCAGG